MFFGNIKTKLSEGSILSASITLKDNDGKRKISKGTKIDQNIKNLLLSNNISSLFCANLEKDDIDENNSAHLIASALINKNKDNLSLSLALHGRCNIVSEIDGLLQYKPNQLYKINGISEEVGIGAKNPYTLVKKKQVVATIKIIPFAVNKKLVDKIKKISKQCFEVLPFLKMNIHLIQTQNEGTLEKVLNKTRMVTQKRLEKLGNNYFEEQVCNHDIKSLSQSIKKSLKTNADIILIFGASAISDRNDIVPLALLKNKGEIIRLGMPVEPGNLMLLGKIEKSNKTIFLVGMPSCARTEKENGVDWILWRLFSGLNVSNEDINQMGAGGLL